MSSPVRLLPCALSDLFAQVSRSRCMTLADRYGLMAALLDETLEEEELRSINRLLRALQKGQIKVIDDLSSVA